MSVNDIIAAAAAEAAALLGSESDERTLRIARIETRMLLRRIGISDENRDKVAGDEVTDGVPDAISDETADALILAAARLTAGSIVAADPAYAERISVGDLTLESRGADEIVCALERGAESALRLIEGRAPARLIAVKGGAR